MQKIYLLSLLPLFMACSEPVIDEPGSKRTPGNSSASGMAIPFSHMGFIEPLENSTYARKTDDGIRDWINGDTYIKFFFNVVNQPAPTDTVYMRLKGKVHEDVRVEMMINDSIKETLSLKKGDLDINLTPFIPLKSAYQCISFKGLDGNRHYPDLDTMFLEYGTHLVVQYNTSRYGAPATHYNYSNVNDRNIEWSLGEVMIKEEACRPDMYYMVSGFNGGYSGMQVSSDFDLAHPKGNTFLFSVWSDFDTQNPSLIPDQWQPWTDHIRKGSDMRDEGFGNEGSGVHANWYYKWNPNIIYKILIRQENVGTIHRNGNDYPDCKAYTCWLYVPELGGWQFFVRYIRPNDTRGSLGVPGSFVENPSGTHSSSKFRGYYRHWIKYQGAQNWTKLTQAWFGTTGANEDHPRYDVGMGKEVIQDQYGYGGEFGYIFSGGFIVNNGKAGVTQTMNFTEMPAIDLAALPELENFDNLMEGDTPNGIERLERTNWSASASSQETDGPYEDGHANLALDGDISTFWHTQYTGAEPSYPHWIGIDMGKKDGLNGFYIQSRGRDVTKTIRIEISNDNTNWNSLGEFTLQNNGKEQKIILSDAVECRYFKIVCLNGYSSTPFTSMSEIGAYRNK